MYHVRRSYLLVNFDRNVSPFTTQQRYNRILSTTSTDPLEFQCNFGHYIPESRGIVLEF